MNIDCCLFEFVELVLFDFCFVLQWSKTSFTKIIVELEIGEQRPKTMLELSGNKLLVLLLLGLLTMHCYLGDHMRRIGFKYVQYRLQVLRNGGREAGAPDIQLKSYCSNSCQ